MVTIPKNNTIKSGIFWHKMTGDYEKKTRVHRNTGRVNPQKSGSRHVNRRA
jgi:hypothetical protein